MYPHQEILLEDSPKRLEYGDQQAMSGCTNNLTMKPFEFRAYVPQNNFVNPPVLLTAFKPGHDYRIESGTSSSVIPIEFQASVPMDCASFKDVISIHSITDGGSAATIDQVSVKCKEISVAVADWSGAIASAWSWKANLTNVKHGI